MQNFDAHLKQTGPSSVYVHLQLSYLKNSASSALKDFISQGDQYFMVD